jgi:hypothetical protein
MSDNSAVREFYSLLRATIKRARIVGHLKLLINEQKMPSTWEKCQKQWAMDDPLG